MGQGRSGRMTGAVRGAALVVALDVAIAFGFAGHLSHATAVGSSDGSTGDPIELLGTVLHTTCPSAPQARGDGVTVVCRDWTAITSPSGVTEVVSLYGPGNAVVDAYGGVLPQGLRWGQSIQDAWSMLGRPSHITGVYGTPTLVYMYEGLPYGSLELRFDARDLLTRVNATLLR